jgi:hypothetical protein
MILRTTYNYNDAGELSEIFKEGQMVSSSLKAFLSLREYHGNKMAPVPAKILTASLIIMMQWALHAE